MSPIPALAPPGSGTGIGNYGPWHTVLLGGDVLPGKWTVVQGSIYLKHLRNSKAGADGANPTFHGLDPQQFDLEGEQYTDDERNALARVLSVILPQPRASKHQYPVQLQHPSVQIFGFGIAVHCIGATHLQFVGPGTTRMKLHMLHYLPAYPGDPVATNTPTRAIRNNRKARQDAQNPPNPVPTDITLPGPQLSIAGPPLNYTPGQ